MSLISTLIAVLITKFAVTFVSIACKIFLIEPLLIEMDKLSSKPLEEYSNRYRKQILDRLSNLYTKIERYGYVEMFLSLIVFFIMFFTLKPLIDNSITFIILYILTSVVIEVLRRVKK